MAPRRSIHARKVSVQALTYEELAELNDSAEQSCDTITAEIQMFEHFLCRELGTSDPQQRSNKPHVVTKRKFESSAVHRKPRPPKLSEDHFFGLDAQSKCEIVKKEIEEQAEASIRFRNECDNIVDNYQAIISEADNRLQNFKKDTSDFQADIIRGAINPFTRAVQAEKCVRYLEKKLKNNESLKKKLIIKYSSTKTQEKKLMLELEQKEQIGDVLQEVDFDQLRILNQQYKQTLSERTRDLLALKLMTGTVMKALNGHKKKLQDLKKESDRILSDITAREDFKRRIDAEAHGVKLEMSHIGKCNSRLRTNLGKFQAPKVMDYVMTSIDIQTIQSELKVWERRTLLAEVAVGNYKKTLQRMKRILTF
ncbi:hypothetical protein BsWGS_15557 [Bradybaena similaris]